MRNLMSPHLLSPSPIVAVLADKNYEVSDEEDDLPFACYICREKFTKPVVTR